MNQQGARCGSWILRLPLALLAAQCAGTHAFAAVDQYPTPLPVDSDLKVFSLPEQYPKDWAFLTYSDVKFEIRDVGSDNRTVEGQLPAFESATALVSTRRPEIYVADTIWSRGNRGTRTDFITVYDKRTLAAVGEIVLPGAKRGLIIPMQGMFSFTDDERLGLVYNFTPAMSVTVVDFMQRKVLGEIATPGCSLIFPTGQRGFSSLCGSGTLLSVQLDEKGRVAGRNESIVFNRLDTDPLFTASAVSNGIRYFPSLRGRVQPLDLRSATPKILPDWNLVTPQDEAGNWRPSGRQLIAAGDDGLLYIIMQPDAREGSYKEGGTEVWVVDPMTRSRVRRLRLVRPGASVDVTHGVAPLLLVAAGEQLDVYELPNGNLVRSLDAPARTLGMIIEAVK